MSHFDVKNNIALTKILNKKDSILSFDTELPEKLIMDQQRKRSRSHRTTVKFSSISILQEKKFVVDNDLDVKSRFGKPHSVLNKFLVAKENNLYEKKYELKRKNFNVKNYLDKERDDVKEILNLDRRKSFLNFFEYLQKPSDLEEAILDEEYNDSEDEEDENNSTPNLSFLTQDSELKILEDTINDKLLPQKIGELKTFKDDYISYDKVTKNINTNKLIQLIRNNIFDREYIDTNINLTTKELSEFYRKRNRQFEEQLFIDNKKIRSRKEEFKTQIIK